MVHVPFLTELIVFLIATVVVVPLARALHLSPILGYLAVGVLAGPSWLGLVHNVEQIRSFAELGVVFLLFAVGLELSFERLKTFAPMIFGLGAAQVVTTSAAIAGIAYLFGNSIQVSVLLGLCLSLSSTAMVIQLLSERGQLVTRHGRASFAVLLFQDLAVVPILMLVTVFGSQGDGGDIGFQALSVFFKALLATGLIILIGHFLLPRLFHLVTASRAPEVFVAMALLTILATSLATGLAGLSMALGAFLAGLLLSKTEFRHQIESDIEPFKGLLLGLFFMTVGMSIDLAAIADRAVMTALSVIGLIALKAVIVFGLCLAFGLQREVAIRVSLLLAEAGEFAFVVIGVATLQYALIPDDVAQFMVIVAGTSMALTPLLALGAGLLGGQLQKHRDKGESAKAQSTSASTAAMSSLPALAGSAVPSRSSSRPEISLTSRSTAISNACARGAGKACQSFLATRSIVIFWKSSAPIMRPWCWLRSVTPRLPRRRSRPFAATGRA